RGNGGIVKIKTVINRIADAIQGAVEAYAAISVAGNFVLLSVRLVGDCLQFFHGKRGLRNQVALLIDPGAVRHVDLDPVSAILKLLAGSLAQFYRAIGKLRAFRYSDVRVVAFQRVAAGHGDGAGGGEDSRTGNEAAVHGHL